MSEGSDQLLGACELGATPDELHVLLGDRLRAFNGWIHGQTLGLCPEHGEVVYRIDLERFLAGLHVVD